MNRTRILTLLILARASSICADLEKKKPLRILILHGQTLISTIFPLVLASNKKWDAMRIVIGYSGMPESQQPK
jgi:hypothetical protein